MAGEGMLQTVPDDAISSGTDTGTPGKIPYLSAEWVNERVANVTARVEAYISRIIDDGLLADGYLPFETPVTDEMLARMAPEEFRALFDTTPTIEGKAALLARMKSLKLPPRYLLPFEEAFYPANRPDVAREPLPAVSSSGATV